MTQKETNSIVDKVNKIKQREVSKGKLPGVLAFTESMGVFVIVIASPGEETFIKFSEEDEAIVFMAQCAMIVANQFKD